MRNRDGGKHTHRRSFASANSCRRLKGCACAVALLIALVPEVSTAQRRDDLCKVVINKASLADLPEASGLAVGSALPSSIFAIGDSGLPIVVVLDEAGVAVRKIAIQGVKKIDWEALTIARCGSSSCVFVGDIGDNRQSRSTVTLYRMAEAAMTKGASINAEVFELSYPDGPHDAESLFATGDGQLFLVTKERARARIYRVSTPLLPGQRHVLASALTLELPDMKGPGITDAAVSPDGKWIGLRSSDMLWLYGSAALLEGRTDKPLAVDLRELAEPQGEGLAFGANGMVYVAGEGGSRNRPGTFAALRCSLPSS